jgi:hypothetical protein
LSGGRHATRKIKRAQILVAANDGLSDEVIAATLKVSGSTIYRTKRRFVEANLEGALSEEPRPGVERKLSSKEEALLVATACSKPPPGGYAGNFSFRVRALFDPCCEHRLRWLDRYPPTRRRALELGRSPIERWKLLKRSVLKGVRQKPCH